MKLIAAIKACFISSDVVDDAPYSRVQVTYNDVVSDSVRALPYGYDTSPPINELALALLPYGREGTFYSLPIGGKNRFKDLKPGEVQLGNPVKRSSVKFDEDGNILVTTPEGNLVVTLTQGNFSLDVTGDATVTVSGNLDATVQGTTSLNSTGNVNLTAPTVAITGNVTVTGTVTAVGDVIGLGKSLGLHTHNYTDDGNPLVTAIPN